MPLSADFTAPQTDSTGRRFVIHVPTGMRYLIREQDHAKGHVTTYQRMTATVTTLTPKAPQAPKAKHRPHSDDHFARATFIEGSEP
jgi:hypothetical protein